MQKTKIKKLIFAVVIPLIVLDTTLLYAAQTDTDAALLDKFKMQLNEAKRVSKAPDPTFNRVAETTTPTSDKAAESPVSVQSSSAQGAVPLQMPAMAMSARASYEAPSYPSVQGYLDKEATPDQTEAFNAVTDQAMPMTAEQIQAMRRMMAASQRAAAAPAETPARPVTSSQLVSLAPGATPPVVRLSAGFISTLVFVDATGADWPITSIDNGNPDAFNISWDKQGNTLMIQAKKAYTFGNLAIVMKGLSTPVMLTLVPGQKEIDYRIDFRVSGLSPDSQRGLVGNGLPNTANNELLRVLDNIPPEDAVLLKVPGGQARAWLANEKIYLRTRFLLLSPGYISVMKSPDGTYAYEIQKTPSILISQYGKPVELRVEGV